MRIIKKPSIFTLIICLSIKTLVVHSAEELNTQMIQLSTEFKADEGSLTRFYDVWNSPERRNRLVDFYQDYQKKLDGIAFEEISLAEKVDYTLFQNYLKQKLYDLDVEGKEYAEIRKWIKAGEPLYELEKSRRRGKQMNWQAVASQLDTITEDFLNLQGQLKKEKPAFESNLTKRGYGIILGQRHALKSIYEFYNGFDPEFSWWMEQPYILLDSVMMDYAESLRAQVDSSSLQPDDGSGIFGSPIGRKEIIRQLRFEMIPYNPEELIEIAQKEFKWCEAQLLQASTEMGFGNDWKAAQEKVKQTYVPVGEQPELMYQLYQESVDFLKDKELVTIPPLAEETWRMKMLSAKRQKIAPFFLGGEVLQIAYPTNEMSHEHKLMSMRGNNPHFARAVIHHEIIAGHHLQRFMNARFNNHRFYYNPFWTEGWALYWEMLLWDQGFARSAEDKMGMLFWRMHRCARIVFSLKYHLGEWTPQQCIDYLVDKVGHERSTAEGEVRRSFTAGYGALYQLAYMTGGLQFYQLKNEMVDSGKMSYKEFHDAILKEHNIPVEMVRALLMDRAPKKDFQTKWKFYE